MAHSLTGPSFSLKGFDCSSKAALTGPEESVHTSLTIGLGISPAQTLKQCHPPPPLSPVPSYPSPLTPVATAGSRTEAVRQSSSVLALGALVFIFCFFFFCAIYALGSVCEFK